LPINYSSSTAATTINNDLIWRNWVTQNSTTSTGGTIVIDDVWRNWTATVAATSSGEYTITVETDEQRARRTEQRRQEFDSENARIAHREQLRQEAIRWAHDNLPTQEEREAYIEAEPEQRREIQTRVMETRRQRRWALDVLDGWFRGAEFAEERAQFENAEYEEQRRLITAHQQLISRRREEEAERQRERQRGAEARAKELLKMVVTPLQFEQFERDGEIAVTGSEGGQYVVRSNTHEGNVDYYEDGRKCTSFCAHPRMYYDNDGHRRIPTVDAVVSQILALQHDEFDFIVTANQYSTWVDGPGMRLKERAREAITARRTAEQQQRPVFAIAV